MSTAWLMDDEIDSAEMLDLLEEARADVDRKYRRGTVQPMMIPKWGWERWSSAHDLMESLTRELAED